MSIMPIDEETKKRILSKGAKPEEILGISSPIILGEARKVYMKLALQVHPDKNQDDEKATEVFQEVNNAWEKLQEKLSKKTPPQQSSGQSSHATRHAPKQNQESNPHTQSSPLSKQEELRQKIEIELNQINPKYIDEFKKCLGDVNLSKRQLDTSNTQNLEITLLKVQAAKELMYIWSKLTKPNLLLRMGQAKNKDQLQAFINDIKNLRKQEMVQRKQNQELKEKLTRMKTKLEKPWYTKSLSKFLSKKSSSIPSKMKIELVKTMLKQIEDLQLTDLDDAFKQGLHATYD